MGVDKFSDPQGPIKRWFVFHKDESKNGRNEKRTDTMHETDDHLFFGGPVGQC